MPDEAAKMRAEAERCRQLAEHMHTASTREMLERMADEFDEEAERLEGGDQAL